MISILTALLLCHAQPAGDSILVPMSDHVRLFVKEIRNDKPLCIFLHGGPGAWSRSFEDLHGDEFSSLFSMVFFDQRGGGRSDTAADYSPKRMVQDIEELRIHLHAEHIYLLAHSFGGILAEQYAETYPNHLAGLILLNCTLDLDNSFIYQIAYMNQLSGHKGKAADTTIEAKDLIPAFFAGHKIIDSLGLSYKILSDNKAAVDTVNAIDNTYPGPHDMAQKVWDMPEYFRDFSSGTFMVNTPVLVISGTKDHAVGPDAYKKFHFPHQTTSFIDGGHLIYYEKTSEVLDTIRDWLKKRGSGI